MLQWKKSGDYNSIADFIEKMSGSTETDIFHPVYTPPTAIDGMEQVAAVLQGNTNPIVVIGDYDVDGITSTAILAWMFRAQNDRCRCKFIIPRRFTDGYGIPRRIIDRIHSSIVITVDNGITATEEIQRLRENANIVIVLDHHQPGNNLPPASVLCDPHICPEKNGFVDYCGAGLAYKLAEIMIPNRKKELEIIKILACIGTIADCVPLIGDNRRIVKEGLELLNSDTRFKLPWGIRAILDCCGQETFSAETIAFRIAPLLNAPGRLYDQGGTSALNTLICNDQEVAYTASEKMVQINNARKALVSKWTEPIMVKAQEQQKQGKCPIVIYEPHMDPGIVGIVTGKVSETLNTPTFLFTEAKGDTSQNPVLHGSGRSCGDYNFISVLDAVRDIAMQCGGHTGAAGISIRRSDLDKLTEVMRSLPQSRNFKASSNILYDFEIRQQEVPSMMAELKKFEPFGAGVPMPLFAIRNVKASSKRPVMLMGANQEHLRINTDEFSAVGFGMSGKIDIPPDVPLLDLVGTITENEFRGRITPQVLLKDIGVSE